LNQKKIREKWKEETLQKNKLIKDNYNEFIKKNNTIRMSMSITDQIQPFKEPKDTMDGSKINNDKTNISSFDNFLNDSALDKLLTPTIPSPENNYTPYYLMDQNEARNSTTLKMQLSSLRNQIKKSTVFLSNKRPKWDSINLTESTILANNNFNNNYPLQPTPNPLTYKNKTIFSETQTKEILRYPIYHGISKSEDEEALEKIKKNYLLFTENNEKVGTTQNKFSSKEKDNTLEIIKNGFRSKEIAKLKAFQKYEEIKDQYSKTPSHIDKGKIFIEPLLKFSVPKKFQIKIDEFKKKYNKGDDRTKSFDLNGKKNFHFKNKSENNVIQKISCKVNTCESNPLRKITNFESSTLI
jgi:hypothetical protein